MLLYRERVFLKSSRIPSCQTTGEIVIVITDLRIQLFRVILIQTAGRVVG